MCSDDSRLANWRTVLAKADVAILSRVARQVEMLVADRKNAPVMERFRSQLVGFGKQWKTYRDARVAWQNGTWHGGMGEPPDPLGWIWPYAYGTGWETWR